ncbi:alpha/beta hydrolase [Xenophilus sp. AP218F]|nr:alpha/beta hydrolase [Xenophilus sp. AP218F]
MRALLWSCCLWLALPALAGEETITVSGRPGVSERFLLLTPATPPAASLILFAGGDGALGLSADGSLRRDANFLVRTRQAWMAQGFAVAVADAPSDHPQGLPGDFRESAEHAADIAAVIDYLRGRAAAPVWLVGTSRGTTSAAAIAIRLPDKVDGVVLTSSIDSGRGSLTGLRLDALRQPALLIHHRRDACRASRFDNLQPVLDSLSAAAARQLLAVDGGKSEGDPCQPWAWHGYNGIEEQVVRQAADWIKAHAR